jgi:hypothetical protein
MWNGTNLTISNGNEIEIRRGIRFNANEVRATMIRNITTGVDSRNFSVIEGTIMPQPPTDFNPPIRGHVRAIEVTNNTNFELDPI